VILAVNDPTAKAEVRFVWRISSLTLENPGPQETPMNTDVDGFTLKVTGGPAPYTWRAENLPDGLSIDAATGVVSGTATHGTRYLSTVYVKDNDGDEVATTFVWNVPPAKNNDMRFTGPSPSDPDQTSRAGGTVSLTVTADDGSNSGYEWRAIGLPPGLSVAGGRSSAVISGKPTIPGIYRVEILAQDSKNKAATLMFTWTVGK
jgi:hypothetical protein